MTDEYLARIGNLIRDARLHRGMTQTQVAEILNTSQSAVARMEQGKQNLSLETVAKVSEALDHDIVIPASMPQHLRIEGGR